LLYPTELRAQRAAISHASAPGASSFGTSQENGHLAVIRFGIEVADVNTVLVADWLGQRRNQLSSRSVNKDI